MTLFRVFIICFVAISISNATIAKKNTTGTIAEKKAEIVIDYTNGNKVLFSKNADKKRFPASLTKMMTVYMLLDAVKHKKITLNTKFKTSKFAAAQMPSILGIKVGSQISVSDIIKALFVKSANDVAVIAAEGLSTNVQNFCKQMNQKAKHLGMKNTHFENPSGVPNIKQTTTARDMATLGMALYKDFPQYRHFFALKKFTYRNVNYATHCKILHWYKGADCAKTGYICASGFNLMVTAARYNKSGKQRRLFVVVMGGEKARSRDTHAGQLMDRYFGEYTFVEKNARSKSKAIQAKNSLAAQIDKSEMIEDIIHADEEVFISKESFNAMLDNIYKDDDELISAEDEILIDPGKDHSIKTK